MVGHMQKAFLGDGFNKAGFIVDGKNKLAIFSQSGDHFSNQYRQKESGNAWTKHVTSFYNHFQQMQFPFSSKVELKLLIMCGQSCI